MAITKLVGSSVYRREDPRLLRGAGRFVADIALPDMLYLAIVRSSRPHAIIRKLDRSAAEAQEGVLLVLDGAEIAATVHPLPSIDLFPDSKPALMRALAVDRVRYAGEPIAIVVATHTEIAQAAAKAVQVDYEDLPVLLDPEEAALDVTLLYPEHGTNVANVCHQGVGNIDLATRGESFVATTQAREQIHHVRAAYDGSGVISALELNSITNNGAAMATLSTTPASISSAMFRGPYRIPNYRAKSLSVLTNKTPLAVYRGAGHPQAVHCMEQIMDRIARDLDIDRIELRQRNMLGPEELPSDRGTEIVLAGKVVYDSGDYPEALNRAVALFAFKERQTKQAAARAEGRLVGLGVACLVEETAIGPYESGYVRVEPSGCVTVLTGASPHGQGTATAIAQLVADELQISLDCIFVKHGDTGVIPDGLGTFASRGGAVGGAAARLAARRVKEKALALAAKMLGTQQDDLEWCEGGARIRNKKAQISLAAIARRAAENPLSPGLNSVIEEAVNHQVPGIAFANGVHMAEVEINPETGQLRVTHYVAFHDCGTVINPMIVEGQVHGGVAQGLGGMLFEEICYDDAGYPLTNGFLNYLLPTAADMPHILSGSMASPSPLNPFGMKGAGEGGTVGAVGSLASAIADALEPLGIRLDGDGPFTPPTLLRLIQSAFRKNNGPVKADGY